MLIIMVLMLYFAISLLSALIPANISVALKLVPKFYELPTALWCTYIGLGCSTSSVEEFKNVTSSASAQIQQASKVINSMDRFGHTRLDLMSNSVLPSLR
jgi:hypothetical protein